MLYVGANPRCLARLTILLQHMVQHGPSVQNPKGIISHFFLGRVTFQMGL